MFSLLIAFLMHINLIINAYFDHSGGAQNDKGKMEDLSPEAISIATGIELFFY